MKLTNDSVFTLTLYLADERLSYIRSEDDEPELACEGRQSQDAATVSIKRSTLAAA